MNADWHFCPVVLSRGDLPCNALAVSAAIILHAFTLQVLVQPEEVSKFSRPAGCGLLHFTNDTHKSFGKVRLIVYIAGLLPIKVGKFGFGSILGPNMFCSNGEHLLKNNSDTEKIRLETMLGQLKCETRAQD